MGNGLTPKVPAVHLSPSPFSPERLQSTLKIGRDTRVFSYISKWNDATSKGLPLM